jgi:hypothetical protein
MPSADVELTDDLPHAYARWRRWMLLATVVAALVGMVTHGTRLNFRVDFGDEQPSTLLVLGVVALSIGFLGPGLAAGGLAVAAAWTWRRPRRSSRLARAAWAIGVIGPVPVLLLPVSLLLGLEPADALRTSTNQIRYLLTITAPALFALLPGAVAAALVLKRFLPESRAPGQVVLLAAPACIAAYVLPLGVLAQVSFHSGLYFGLLTLACVPVLPLLIARRLQRSLTPTSATRLVRSVGRVQLAFVALGAGLLVRWASEYPLLQEWVGQVNWMTGVGFVAGALSSKWLTTVVVTDMLLIMLHQSQEANRAMAGSPEENTLSQRLDALGGSLQRSLRR